MPPTRKRKATTSDIAEARRVKDDARRAEAMALLMGGFTYEQIAERLQVSSVEVGHIITRALQSRPTTAVDEMRQIENARLDRLQVSIWTRALEGDSKAINDFLKISHRRARLNGLDAPMQIEMSGHIRIEMERALNELENIVLGEVVRDSHGDSDEKWLTS